MAKSAITVHVEHRSDKPKASDNRNAPASIHPTAKQLRSFIELAINRSLKEFPGDVEMRSRLFVSLLSSSLACHDITLAEQLEGVWRNGKSGQPA